MLQRQPAPRRPHEGAVGGDDQPVSAGHSRVVPEQAVQGQETEHTHEADTAAARQGQLNFKTNLTS